MQNIIKSIFLSSEGNGNISLLVKGVIVVGLGYAFPAGDQGSIAEVADTILTILGMVGVVWGGVRKLGNGRWSAPAK